MVCLFSSAFKCLSISIKDQVCFETFVVQLKFFCRRYGNSTIQTLLAAKDGPLQGGSSQRITIVPPLSAAWFSDIVIPAVIVSIVVVISLFAIVVLLLLRRHIHLDGHESKFNSLLDNDYNPLLFAQARIKGSTMTGMLWLQLLSVVTPPFYMAEAIKLLGNEASLRGQQIFRTITTMEALSCTLISSDTILALQAEVRSSSYAKI